MAVVADRIIVELYAKLDEYQRKLQGAKRVFESTMDAQERAARRAEEQIKRSTSSIGTALRSSAATFGAYFGVREISQIADAFTEFQNRLRVAGVEGQNLGKVQDALFKSAQRYGVELGALGELYSRTSTAAKELGIGQADLLSFTDNVSAALKVQGGSAASAQGALLQLSQALAAGTVRAEEFNSINEGALPVLQAVAAGSDRFEGSVAKLRAAVLDGTVSSKEFFEAFQKGAVTLQDRAAKATLTTGQALTTLRNALTVYIGEANQASGASAALGGGIKALSENLDSVIPALAILGTALGVGFVANAVKAQVAAARTGGAILGAFGGPVGIAITAVTVALGSFAIEAANTQRLLDGTANVINDTRDAIEALGLSGHAAAGSVGDVGSEAAGATPKITSFAGAVGEAAQKLHDLAKARREADIAELESRRTKLSTESSELFRRTGPGAREALGEQNYLGGNLANLGRFLLYGGRSMLSGGRSDDEINARRRSIAQSLAEIDEALKRARRQTDEDYANKPEIRAQAGVGATNAAAINQRRDEIAALEQQKASASGAALAEIKEEIAARQREIRFLRQGVSEEVAKAAAKREAAAEAKAGSDAAREGKKAETAAAKAAREAEQARLREVRSDDAYNADLRRYQSQYLDALGDTAHAAELREKLQRELIDAEAAAAKEDVRLKGPAGTRQFGQAQVDALTQLIENTRLQQQDNVTLRRQTQARQDALDLTLSALGNREDLIRAEADLAVTAAERRAAELRLLDLQRQEEEARLRAITDVRNTAATAAEKRIAQERLDAMPSLYGARREQIRRDTETPLESYARQAALTGDQMNEALSGVAADGLADLNRGLTDAVLNFESLGDTAYNVIRGIAERLVSLQIERFLTGPLAKLLDGATNGAPEFDFAAAAAGADKALASVNDPLAGGDPAAKQASADVSALGDAADAAGSALLSSMIPSVFRSAIAAITGATADTAAASATGSFAVSATLAAVALDYLASAAVAAGTASVATAGFASGGVIRGPGTGTSDSILARVSNGEGIVTAKGMRRLGARGLDAINSGRVPHFASGGLVAATAPTIRPMNVAAASAGGSQILSRDFEARVGKMIAKAAATGPRGDVTVVNAVDAGDFVSKGLSTPVGGRALMNFIRSNSRAVSSAISS